MGENRVDPDRVNPMGYGHFPMRPIPLTRRFDLSIKNILVFVAMLLATFYTTWLIDGVWFSLPIMAILGAHEFGHYLACRRNDIDASLPFFVPAPPYFLAGTFGAFIKIKEPIPNRQVLMEIGASGPIWGFVVALPVFIWGLFLSELVPIEATSGYFFGDSLLLLLIYKLVLGVNVFAKDITVNLHPMAYAGWFGFFVTAMNLLPIGQLDGGHIVYSLFGQRAKWIFRGFFALLLILGYFWPGWYLFAFLVFLLKIEHPPLLDEFSPLKPKHKWQGGLSILIFILTFIPVPIEFIA